MVSIERDAQRRGGPHTSRLLSRRLASPHPSPRVRRLHRRGLGHIRLVRHRHPHQHRQRLTLGRAGASPQGRGACAVVSILPRHRERCMSPFDLTNLAALKAWLGLPSAPGPSDATLSALGTPASRSIYAALSRPSLLPFSYAETIDLETSRVTLRRWPVLEVTSVTWRGIVVPPDENADPEASFGYVLQPDDGVPPGRPQALDLFGHHYRSGRQSLVVSYRSGYAVQSEAQAVPAASPFQLSAFSPYGPWGSDLGATYTATGAPL